MEEIEPVLAGYVRLVLYPRQATPTLTPGEVVSWSDVAPEFIGPLMIGRKQVLIDIHCHHSKHACEALAKHGSCCIAQSGVHKMEWHFIRLGIGRNQGLGISHLKRIMGAAQKGPLGKISINNTYSLVGLREDFVQVCLQSLENKRINGFRCQARLAQENEIGRKEPRFTRIPDAGKQTPQSHRQKP
ncbi:MAG: DbpA RNA binding domain-containing protein [Planctomycetes bacterium]|nr:DbpA RNA binding domain-containing protein [Planctomycetota bacterium]